MMIMTQVSRGYEGTGGKITFQSHSRPHHPTIMIKHTPINTI